MPKIAIVAGEASGDLLGSHLIQALQARRPDLEFVGIAGPKMIAAGAKTLFPMEKLSVRGYVEVLKHLYGLLKLRKSLLNSLLAIKPDIFIGIDAPDFNFWLERKLKDFGITTIHYVSPSIWAWRKGRINGIKRAISHMLVLFPFEPKIYEDAGIPVTYVGHPLADILPLAPDRSAALNLLKIKSGKKIIAMLPGSRQSEVEHHAELFIKTVIEISKIQTDIQFLVPLISRETRDFFKRTFLKITESNNTQDLNDKTTLPDITILFGHAHEAMEAADVVVVASGTATLEAALIKRPMVITYRISNTTWQIVKRMNYLPYVGLPNILAGKFVVPELLQHDATPEKLAEATLKLLNDNAQLASIEDEFTKMHISLKQNTAEKAADAILAYL